MLKKTLIDITTSAANAVIIIENWNKDGSVFLVGSGLASITETINIQIPAVLNPDKDTDAHWENFVYDSITYVLDASNMAQSLPLRGTYRINKPASTSAFGVIFE